MAPVQILLGGFGPSIRFMPGGVGATTILLQLGAILV